MTATPIRSVLIVGGGTAGWMMAAASSRFLLDGRRSVTLVESDLVGAIGVGEATIPPILAFNELLGLDEIEFLQVTGGTYKLGIRFEGWKNGTDAYFHPFGPYGRSFEGLNFHQIWLKLRGREGIGELADYSMSAVAAVAGRFAHPVRDSRSPLSNLAYAYHFDAARYAGLLRQRAVGAGVRRIEGTILSAARDPISGHVKSVRLNDGRELSADLFVDCSVFRSLLLGAEMKVPFVDWSSWLPCDRAVAAPSAAMKKVHPFTVATARDAGWQWRIPLRHRTGNGHVYASSFMDDAAAERILMENVDAPLESDPITLRFAVGHRQRFWEKNVVAIGLAGGFLEPLESTSIHLIQEGISKLFALFPDQRFSEVERDQYNRFMSAAYASVRDFVILHYHATSRTDSRFWQYVRTMPIPETLASRIALFREKARIFRYDDELFAVPNWTSVLLGQGVWPVGYDPLVEALDEDRLVAAVRQMRDVNQAVAASMPFHAEALATLGSRAPNRA